MVWSGLLTWSDGLVFCSGLIWWPGLAVCSDQLIWCCVVWCSVWGKWRCLFEATTKLKWKRNLITKWQQKLLNSEVTMLKQTDRIREVKMVFFSLFFLKSSIRLNISAWVLACENIRFSSLFATGDVSRGETSATQRQKFHTDDVKSVRNPVRSAGRRSSYIVLAIVYEWQTKGHKGQM